MRTNKYFAIGTVYEHGVPRTVATEKRDELEDARVDAKEYCEKYNIEMSIVMQAEQVLPNGKVISHLVKP